MRRDQFEKWMVALVVIIVILFAILLTPRAYSVDTHRSRLAVAQTDESIKGGQLYHSGENLGITDENEPAIWSTEKWVITAYCNCEECVGVWSVYKGLTASGATIREGVTIAADPSIPFGTVIEIEGIGERTVQDRGSAIIGNHIDLFFNTHEAACEWGLQMRRVRTK